MGLFSRNCSNCGRNPCTVDCAKQEYPRPNLFRTTDKNQPDKRQQAQKDGLDAQRARVDSGGSKSHLMRYVKPKDLKEVMAKYGHLIDKVEGEQDGFKRVVLKRGKDKEMPDYKHH